MSHARVVLAADSCDSACKGRSGVAPGVELLQTAGRAAVRGWSRLRRSRGRLAALEPISRRAEVTTLSRVALLRRARTRAHADLASERW